MRFRYLASGTLLVCLLLLAVWPTVEVQAHFCDDNYTDQQDRENCWWRYWNGLTTDADRAQPRAESPPLGGMVCDSHFTDQQEREDCWWRHWNDRLLVTIELRSDSETLPRTAAQSSNPTSRPPSIHEFGGNVVQLGQYHPCGNKRMPRLAPDELSRGVMYACDKHTDKWVRVSVQQPGIDYASDCQLQPASTGGCAAHFTHYDPIRKTCIYQPNPLTCN